MQPSCTSLPCPKSSFPKLLSVLIFLFMNHFVILGCSVYIQTTFNSITCVWTWKFISESLKPIILTVPDCQLCSLMTSIWISCLNMKPLDSHPSLRFIEYITKKKAWSYLSLCLWKEGFWLVCLFVMFCFETGFLFIALGDQLCTQ